MYRWWQAADRDPSGREVLVDVSVYCSVWRGKVREKEREQNDSRTSSVSDDSVKKNTKLTVKFITRVVSFPRQRNNFSKTLL